MSVQVSDSIMPPLPGSEGWCIFRALGCVQPEGGWREKTFRILVLRVSVGASACVRACTSVRAARTLILLKCSLGLQSTRNSNQRSTLSPFVRRV